MESIEFHHRESTAPSGLTMERKKMRRIHIALAVANLEESITDYTKRLGATPNVVVDQTYAMWRHDQMNFSISQLPEQAGQLRHLGFEDDDATGFTADHDPNGILWELFSPTVQDEKIRELYGAPSEH